MLVAGYDTERLPPVRLPLGRGAASRPAARSSRSSGTGRASAARRRRPHPPSPTPTGPPSCRSSASSASRAACRSAATASRRCRSSCRARLIDEPKGCMQISVAVDDKRRGRATLRSGSSAALGARRRGQDARQASATRSHSSSNALNIVLYFFSGVALFVGGFLILNAFNMTVLQRMREIGTLRTLGASRRLVTRTILIEALIIGVVGSVLGLGLGLRARGRADRADARHGDAGRRRCTSPPAPAVTAVVIGMRRDAARRRWPARRAGRISPIRAVLGDSRRAPRAATRAARHRPGPVPPRRCARRRVLGRRSERLGAVRPTAGSC